MTYKLSNLFVLCVSFTIFGQDSLKQNGGVVWTGLSGYRWHVKKKRNKSKTEKNFKYKIYSCSHAATICFNGPNVCAVWSMNEIDSTRIASSRFVCLFAQFVSAFLFFGYSSTSLLMVLGLPQSRQIFAIVFRWR